MGEELKENEDDFQKQFSKWNACLKGAKCESCEELFKKVHAGIRADPVHKKKERKQQKPTYTDARKTVIKTKKGTYTRARRFTYDERKANLQMKIKLAQEAAE